MRIQPYARFPVLSADALPATLYGHFTQAIYRDRPISVTLDLGGDDPWWAATRTVFANSYDVAAWETKRATPGSGGGGGGVPREVRVAGRGLHSSTVQLNLSALYGIGGARRGLRSPCCGGVRRCVGCFLVSETAQVEVRSGRA
jgi:hypothetical protein